MTGVIIAGGGPTGLMLAGELRLHGVRRARAGEGGRADQGRPRARPARAQRRGDGPARPAGTVPRARHAVPGRRLLRRHPQAAAGAAGHRTSLRPRHPAAGHRSPARRARHRARRRDPARLRTGRAEPGRRRRDRRAGRRHAAALPLPRRLRRRPQHGAQAARRRLPRRAQPGRDAAGRDGGDRAPGDGGRRGGRGPQDPAAVRRRAACRGRAVPRRRARRRGWPRTARSRRPWRSSGSSCGRSPGPTSACTRRAGCPGSATPPGWPSATGAAGCCWPATRRTSTRRPAGRGSTSASRTRSTWAGSWPPRSTAGRRRGCWTATTPNGTRWPPTCWTTPARRWS